MQRRDFCKATLIGGACAAFTPWRSFAAEVAASGNGDLRAITSAGAPTVIPAASLKAFAASVRGRVLSASDAEYDQARRLWNKMFDRHPALIVRCTGAADIQRAVAFAHERQLLLAVRGGGHSFPGYSMCDGGLVIDLSQLRGVRVDPRARTAEVAPGAWIGDLDWESQQYGLATPMGSVSNTGVAGLTLGGGYGWLSRKHGIACDNLIAADVITADAKLVHVNAEENPDLHWGIRGGGGNFGVVSSFEFRLHPVGPKVLAGDLVYEPAQTRAAFDHYRDFASRAPRELSVWLDWGGAPGADGDLTITACYVGDPSVGERLLQPLRTAVKPREDHIELQDYVKVQQRNDGPVLSSYNEYLKSGYVAEVTPALIDTLMSGSVVDETVGMELMHCGGAIADVAPTGTAIAHRRELFQLLVIAAWKDPADNERNRDKIHAAWDKVSQYTSGFYANLDTPDQKAVADNYGPNHSRLAALKRRYDPDNLFRLNANIKPA
jgi:FAD/FMN-containing dehydrogenase